MISIAPLETDFDLAGELAEGRIAEAVDTEVEISVRACFWIESGIVGPRLQVASNERDLQALTGAHERQRADEALCEVVADRQLAELDVRTVLHEVAARLQSVVQTDRVVVDRVLGRRRLSSLVEC